jgi:hypothetical protein
LRGKETSSHSILFCALFSWSVSIHHRPSTGHANPFDRYAHKIMPFDGFYDCVTGNRMEC